jgi:hypothetical protein
MNNIKNFSSFNQKVNEHGETKNYMFFGNLQTIKRLVDEMLEMNETELDSILTEHDWASDHISVATENIEHVFNFLAGNNSDEQQHEEKPLGEPEEDNNIKGFEDFQ